MFAWNVLRPAGTVVGDASVLSPGPGDLVVTLRAPTEPSTATDLHLPTAVFRLGEQATEIPTQGMTGWPDIPADAFTAPLYSLGFGVPAGTRLVIQGDANSASATVRSDIPIDSLTQELDLSGGSAILPSDPGRYVIDLTGDWEEGTATFTALFEVVPVDEAAILAFDEQDPAAPQLSLTVAGATFPATLGTHSYTFDNGSGYADAATPTFTDADLVQVVSGTPLLLQDPPPTVSIMANEGLTLSHGPPVGTPLKLDLGATRAFDLPGGIYLVIVDAQWDDAQARFWLPIEIVDRQVPRSAVVTHDSHAPVPRPVSEACPIVAGALTTVATAVSAGDRLTVSGPISHRFHGSFFLPPTEDYQAWWGIVLDDYSDLGNAPGTIANGEEIKPPLSGPGMLGDYRPNGACEFEITFVVPDVAPGSYGVTVISAYAEGYAAYGTVTIEVLPST